MFGLEFLLHAFKVPLGLGLERFKIFLKFAQLSSEVLGRLVATLHCLTKFFFQRHYLCFELGYSVKLIAYLAVPLLDIDLKVSNSLCKS